MKQLFRTLTLFVLPLLVAACNTDYNFDKVSLEVTVGDTNGIIVPLGEIEKTTIGELLAESGLETNKDGYYGFSYAPEENMEYNVEVGKLSPITGLTPTIESISESLFGGFSANTETFYGKKDLEFPDGLSGGITLTEEMMTLLGIKGEAIPMKSDPHTFVKSFSIKLPKEVASLEEVTFGADGNGSILDIQFDLGGLAGVNQSCTINSLYFELPDGFVIDKLPSDPLYNDIKIIGDNHFEISDYTFNGSHITLDIVLKKVNPDHATLDENNMVTIKEDVTFALDASIMVQPGEIAAVSPYVEMRVTPAIYNATITTNEITHDFSFNSQVTESVDIPEIVSRIDYLSICNADDTTQKPKFNVKVKLSGAPVDELELRDVEILLPEFLDLNVPEGWSYADGKLSANKALIVTNNELNNIIDNLEIKGIKGLSIVNNKIDLNSTIGLSATVAIANGKQLNINTSAEEISIIPTITLDDIAIQEVTGLIDPDLSELLEPQEINLSKLTSSLSGIDMNLNIVSPVMRLMVENPIGVGINADLTLTAYKGEDVVSTITSPTLSIQPATTTNIVINGVAPDSPEYQSVQIDGLADMIAALPDKIIVELSAETNKEKPHILTLQDSYTFVVDYSVEASFEFDSEKEGHIDYTVEIDEVDLSALADIDVLVENLTLNVASESTLPIDLTMDIEFLDENGAPIECITSSTTGKIEGSTTEEAKLSECSIILDIKTPSAESSQPSAFNEIARTKKIRCHLNGTTLAGGGLKPDQYIAAKLSLELGEGITVDLGSLLGAEDDDATE